MLIINKNVTNICMCVFYPQLHFSQSQQFQNINGLYFLAPYFPQQRVFILIAPSISRKDNSNGLYCATSV